MIDRAGDVRVRLSRAPAAPLVASLSALNEIAGGRNGGAGCEIESCGDVRKLLERRAKLGDVRRRRGIELGIVDGLVELVQRVEYGFLRRGARTWLRASCRTGRGSARA